MRGLHASNAVARGFHAGNVVQQSLCCGRGSQKNADARAEREGPMRALNGPTSKLGRNAAHSLVSIRATIEGTDEAPLFCFKVSSLGLVAHGLVGISRSRFLRGSLGRSRSFGAGWQTSTPGRACR